MSYRKKDTWQYKITTQNILTTPMNRRMWLWRDRFFGRELNLLSGMREIGKSTLVVDMAHKILCGGTWPFLPNEPIVTGSVLFMGKEDDISDTIRPKFDALIHDTGIRPLEGNTFEATNLFYERCVGKNGKVRIKSKEFRDLTETAIDGLTETVKEIGNVKLIIIDPIADFAGDTQQNNEKATRDYLWVLRNFARRNNVAILGIRHFNKDEKKSAEQRTGGTTAWQDVPRAVWLVGVHPDDRNVLDPQLVRRTITKSKCNGAKRPINLQYKLRSVSIRVQGKLDDFPVCDFSSEPLNMSRDEVFSTDIQKHNTKKMDKAKEWLLDVLSKGSKSVSWLKNEAATKKIASWRTIEAAKSDLSITSIENKTKGKFKNYSWKLP